MKTKPQIIEYMKNNNLAYLNVLVKETDELGVFVHLTGGRLVDPWNKTLKWKEAWGTLVYTGRPGEFNKVEWKEISK